MTIRVLRTERVRRTLQCVGKPKMKTPRLAAGYASDVRPGVHWKFVAFVSFAVAALVIAELSVSGVDQDSLRLVLRTTARTSALLFALGFATPFVPHIHFYSDSLLISFSASQTLHLIAIIWLVTIRHTQRALIDPPGLLAYTCVAVILARIFNERSPQLSPRLRKLEAVALYVFWVIITGAFAGFFPGIRFSGLHLLIVLLLVISLVMRLASGWKSRSRNRLEMRAQP
jgi:hypothetical protein